MNIQRPSILARIERHLGAGTTARERRKIARLFFVYRRRSEAEYAWIQQLGLAHATRMIRVEGLQHLDQALSRGRGAIVASTHLGYGRMIKPILRLHDIPALLVGPTWLSTEWPEICAADLPPLLPLENTGGEAESLARFAGSQVEARRNGKRRRIVLRAAEILD